MFSSHVYNKTCGELNHSLIQSLSDKFRGFIRIPIHCPGIDNSRGLQWVLSDATLRRTINTEGFPSSFRIQVELPSKSSPALEHYTMRVDWQSLHCRHSYVQNPMLQMQGQPINHPRSHFQ